MTFNYSNGYINGIALYSSLRYVLNLLFGFKNGKIIISRYYKPGYRKVVIVYSDYFSSDYSLTLNKQIKTIRICNKVAKEYKIPDKFYFKIIKK